MTEISSQFTALRDLTKLTGGLHEAQVNQLKMLPLVVFDNVKGSEFVWEADRRFLTFHVDCEKGFNRKNKETINKCNYLLKTVEFLIGTDCALEVKINKRTTFRILKNVKQQ